MNKKFYVTTPIYYPNAKPHLGSLYSTVLADVAARWHKLQKQDTFLLTGTDEHGQKIAEAAQKAGKTPLEFVEACARSFEDTWKQYHIEYNRFIRTTDKDHTKAVQQWIVKLQQQGDIYKSHYTGWYCTSCETFVTEKDQEHANKVPPCPSCGRLTTQVSEEAYFFKLSAYQERLLQFYKEHPDFITPAERLHEIISFVESGLKDLSISRTTVQWGIPFPGDDKHVVYVWADALNNYITGIGYGNPQKTKEFNSWWPADLQVLGKDIVRFHAVYWPAFLMAAGLSMPQKLLVHGWIKMGEQKMSKSLGNVVDPQQLAVHYGADPIRYYLVRYMAVTQDSPFSIEDLEQRITSDLANDLGNLLNRMLMLSLKYNATHITSPLGWDRAEQELQQKLKHCIQLMKQDMYNALFHRAYAHLGIFINLVNSYFHAQEPWRLAQVNNQQFMRVIAATCHSLYAIALLLWPVMPTTMELVLHALGKKLIIDSNLLDGLEQVMWDEPFTLTSVAPIFAKPESVSQELATEKKETMPSGDGMITIDDFAKTELRVGTIVAVEDVPKSDKLYKLTVDFGELGTRIICSGIKQRIARDLLQGKQAVFVVNLQPRTIMNIPSQGMLLATESSDGTLRFIVPSGITTNGSRLR